MSGKCLFFLYFLFPFLLKGGGDEDFIICKVGFSKIVVGRGVVMGLEIMRGFLMGESK